MEENAWDVEAQRRRSPAEVPGRLVNTGPHTAMMGLPECEMAIHTDRQATLHKTDRTTIWSAYGES